MIKILLVGIGGFLGATSRYFLVDLINQTLSKPLIPYGTFAVNIIGCFIIGLLNGISETRQIFSPEIRLLIFIGFLGSFTTFSAFGYETFSLAKSGGLTSSMMNIVFHLLIGLIAVWLGNQLASPTLIRP